MPLDLPKDVRKGDQTRTAHTATEYWNFKYQGYTDVDGPAVAEVSYEDLTPAQKAARTRAENEAKKEAEKNASNQSGGSFDGNPDDDIRNQAGTANSGA